MVAGAGALQITVVKVEVVRAVTVQQVVWHYLVQQPTQLPLARAQQEHQIEGQRGQIVFLLL